MSSDESSVQMSLNSTDEGKLEEATVDESESDDDDVIRNEKGEPLGDHETVSGENRWHVVSAFQKAVRRKNEMLSAWCAWELCRSGYGYQFWKRANVVAMEDTRAECMAPIVVWRCNMQAKHGSGDYSNWSSIRCATRAALALARAPGSHESDYTQGGFSKISDKRKNAFENGNPDDAPDYPVEIPEVAIDMHTQDGKRKGRSNKFFHLYSGRMAEESEIGFACHALALDHRDDFDLTEKQREQALSVVESGNMEINWVDND